MNTNKLVESYSYKVLLGLCVLFSVAIQSLYAQEQQTKIRVISTEDQLPLVGATIVTENAKGKGWITDLNGEVVIDIQEKTLLMISYLGHQSIKKWATPFKTLTVKLEENLSDLDEVVVTGAFIPTTASKSLYQVKKIDSDIIEGKAAVNLSDLLQGELNLKTIQDDVLGTRIVMQGISGPNVKMLIDGVPLVNGEGGEFDLSQLNLNSVERVEIVEGPLSVQYGTNALAGTINIISKSYESEEYLVASNAYVESVGQYNVDLSLAKGWENFSVSVNGARNQFNGFSSTGERKQNWNPRTQYITDIKLKARLKRLNITGTYGQLWENAIGQGNATTAFNQHTSKLSEIASDSYYNTQRVNASLTLDGAITDKQYINIVNGISTYTRGSTRYIQDVIDDMKWKSSRPSDHDTTTYSTITSRGTYVIGDNQNDEGVFLTMGYEVNMNQAEGGRISENAESHLNEYGLFSAIEIPIGEHFKVQPALRFIHSDGYDTKKINFLNANLPILPSLNLMYDFNKNLKVRFAYGMGYRTPSVRERYYEFIDANHYIVGNTDLSPELGSNFNTSLTWTKKISSLKLSLTPTVFFSKIDNKIELVQILDRNTLPEEVPKSVPVARVYENIPNFKSYGFNLAASLNWRKRLELNPGVSLLARSGSEADDNFYQSYEANLNGSYNWHEKNIRFNIFYKYNGKMSEFSKNEDGSIGVLTLDDYNTMDFTISKLFLKQNITLTAGAKNLFDITDIGLDGDGSKGLVLQTGREAFYPISWGRSFFIKINYTISN
ncbi:TonB-dependent receptor [Sediminitomix flava]|uniref:Outer membrane receptor for ferrienterochelin and colicins n=1 Tax=Sediminitomix flava TaxID=379075 RepID=A0A315ZAY6_SEDFL|nr:TonB-dependent receptor [Sediminitomix flava]PWJ41884.1 outer membrane receptor for ferrienterochelin and colicins [Sediminitomix flava]